MTRTEIKEKRRRSRGGCLSCKHLRIKCSEDKPTCEYCHYTKRQCVYPTPTPKQPKQPKQPKSHKIQRKVIPEFELSSSDPSSSSHSPFSISPETWSSQLEYELNDLKEIVQTEPTFYEELTRDLVLTQATSMLGISKFELRLLNFFDQECINLFSFKTNKDIDNAWRYGVPGLFLESELTRLAMFSFAALSSQFVIDLNSIQCLDAAEDDKSFANMYNINSRDPNNMFVKTTNYFMDTITRTKHIISPSEQDPNFPDFQDPKIAKELTVSSILIYSYLVLNPGRLVPLIDFTRESTDLVQIAKGIRHTILNCAPMVIDSEIGGLLFFRGAGNMNPPSLKQCNYSVIVNLREALEDLVSDEVSSEISNEHSILEESITILMNSIYACEFFKFPVPLFRYLMLIPMEFREMLYKMHPFSLRILYVLAALNHVAGLFFYEKNNIWADYMIWYKEFIHSCGCISWNEMDRQLYRLVVDEHFRWPDHTRFHEFDPAVECHKLSSSQDTASKI